MTNIEKSQVLIAQDSFTHWDYTDFCRLNVDVWQDRVKEKNAYDLDKLDLDIQKETRILELCATEDPDTGRGKPHSKTKAESKVRIEFKDKERELLIKKGKYEAMKVFHNTMDRFASAINKELDITYEDSKREPTTTMPTF
jgi:hypothetical protein